MFHKKHYEVIAEAVRTGNTVKLSEMLEKDNPRFDSETFLQACVATEKSAVEQVQDCYDTGHNIGYREVIRCVRQTMKTHVTPWTFHMAMGAYVFSDIHGENLDIDSYTKEIDALMEAWDDRFNFTGHPLRITHDGKIDESY